MSSKTLARHASLHDTCEVAEKERRQTYYEDESQRELSACEEPAGHVNAMTGFDKPPIGLESRISGASTREEPVADVETMTSSEKLPGGMEPGVGGASTDKTPASKTKQAEPKKSEPIASTDYHVITLSEEQYTHLLQSHSWPNQSKSIISIHQEKKTKPSCKSSGGQEPLTSQPTLAQQTMALQTPAQQLPAVQTPVVQTAVQQTPVPIVPAQYVPGQQTTTVLAATEVPTMLTPIFRWIIEHDQRKLSGSGGTEEVVTELILPAAARKLTHNSVTAKPASPRAARKNLAQAEAKESELSASTESHGITLSEEQYTSLLQSLNLPIHSKPFTSTQLEKEAEPPGRCSGGHQLQTPQPTEPQHTMAQQMPAVQTLVMQQTPLPIVPAQQTPEQQTTTMLAGTKMPTPMSRCIIEHDQWTPSGSGGTEEVITALVLPAAARKLTHDSVPAKPASPGAARENLVQAEAKESELSASSESHGITLSEEQYTSMLQSLNLLIHSKPITSTQLEKKAEPPCRFSGGHQLQTPQPTEPQHTMAQQMPAVQMLVMQQTPLPVVPAQQTPGQQTTTVLAATEVPTMLTSTFSWTIEHYQRPPSGSGGTEEVITALAFPAATRKLTYDSVQMTPASAGAAEESPVFSVTAA
nr:fibrous sheath CABYR-binding protein-like [Rhipicephalus microplus]